MLKRITKVTSLLITAASIVSMVPAMADDLKKVDAVEGTIYDAQSKGGGVFLIDGEINGEAEAIYYIKDGKYTKLENAEPGDAIGDIFQYEGKNYLQLADGDYYVNVDSGERTDEDIEGNLNDDADEAVRKAIKNDNDGRFDKSAYTGSIINADTTVRGDGSGEVTMWGISGKYRQYNYKLAAARINGETTSTIYSDPEGNYIDVDYNLGKIGVYTTSDSVTIENTEDTYEIEESGKTYELKAQIKNDRTWDEGPEYIVRTGTLTIWRKEKGADDDTYENITDQVKFGSKNKNYSQAINSDNDVTVLQRISKAQASDDIDGIKYAKDVKTYFITDEDGNHQPLLGLVEDSDSSYDDVYKATGLHAIGGGTQGYNISYFYDFINSKVYAQALNYKTSNGYNYIDVDDYDDTDVELNGFKLGCGDVWALDGGYVKRFNDKENKFDKLYKVDGGMINMHCSIPTDVVVWNKDDESYSIIAPSDSKEDETDSTKATTTTTAAVSVKAGWTKASDGTWSYIKPDGTKTIGWIEDNSAWYYLNESGVMQTGWIDDNGTWYYCSESGEMLYNRTVDGYVLGANGAWVK